MSDSSTHIKPAYATTTVLAQANSQLVTLLSAAAAVAASTYWEMVWSWYVHPDAQLVGWLLHLNCRLDANVAYGQQQSALTLEKRNHAFKKYSLWGWFKINRVLRPPLSLSPWLKRYEGMFQGCCHSLIICPLASYNHRTRWWSWWRRWWSNGMLAAYMKPSPS